MKRPRSECRICSKLTSRTFPSSVGSSSPIGQTACRDRTGRFRSSFCPHVSSPSAAGILSMFSSTIRHTEKASSSMSRSTNRPSPPSQFIYLPGQRFIKVLFRAVCMLQVIPFSIFLKSFKDFKNVKIYMSNPWERQANGIVRDFRIMHESGETFLAWDRVLKSSFSIDFEIPKEAKLSPCKSLPNICPKNEI